MSQPVVIRKYPNRRLYDTSSRRYVNLDDVAALIRQGVEVQVLDARTGEDLTRVVLTQIIVEDVKDQPATLPLDLLRQLVMATDRALSNVRSAALSPFQAVRNLLTPELSQTRDEMEELRQRLAELEAQAGKRRPAARRVRKKPPGKPADR